MKSLLGSAAVLGLSVSGLARAQEVAQEEAQPAADNPEEATGNEIVVTATKREQTLQDVPVAVSVTTAETIERAHIRDIRDLSTVVPSLRVNQLQSSANTNFYIRGFGNGANNAGIEPSVGLFVDGVYRSRSASMIADLPDVSRIEVLRGPQSTLFGKNASAGVISLVTREPQFTLGGNVEASYGNFNAVLLKGVVTGPLSETVAASIAGGYNRRDGYVTDTGSGTKTNERNRWFVRGQLLFKPSSDLKVRLIGDYGRIDELCCAVVNLQRSSPTQGSSQVVQALGGQLSDPANPFADTVAYNIPSSNKIDNYGASGQIDYRMGPLKLTSITAYRKTHAITNQDSDFSKADLLGRNYQDLNIDTFTQELRLSTDWDGPVNALLGAFYFNEKINQHNELYLGTQFRSYADQLITGLSTSLGAPFTLAQVEQILGNASTGNPAAYVGKSFAPGTGFTENYHLADESYSIFSQVDFEVAPRLTVTGGLNYTHDSKTFQTNSLSTEFFSALPLSSYYCSGVTPANGCTAKGIYYDNTVNTVAFNIASGPAFANSANPLTVLQWIGANQATYLGGIVPAAQATVPKLQALSALQFLPPFLNLPNAVENGKVKGGHWNYTARLAYDLTDQINLYASYATGYKAASVNLSRDSRPTAGDLTTIMTNSAYTALRLNNLSAGSRYAGPEDSQVFEAGMKANWGIATLNLAVFKQTIKGFQSNLFTGTGFVLVNAGKQSTFGIEFEGMVKPSEELTITAGVTYLDPKYDSFVLSGVGDLTGTRPAGISPLSATIGGEWKQPVGDGGDHLILHADFHYEAPFALVEGLPNLIRKDPVTGALLPNPYADAIAASTSRKQEINLLNASLTYAMANGIEVAVWGRNVLNNRTILQIFDSPVQVGSISGYPSEPRTYGVSARYRF
ncbi:TonB-dependent receptor [Novosphingobium flavum]|uniref:TonB-dependent receptor n=1 Tax=Novosphingobium flavum TaxID=1778672 RepID=UPI001FEC5BF7|nr:TonB-dependent receptor [Novosphingobium flavum]